MKRGILLGTIVLICVGVVACGYLPPGIERYGSVEVSLLHDLQARTVDPALDMSIDTYEITLAGVGPTVSRTIGGSETSTVFSSLAPGSWTVTVNARNAPGSGAVIIATDTEGVDVVGGQTATVSIVVVPLAGTGTLNVSMSWPAGAVDTPTIGATLRPLGGSEQDISASYGVDTSGDPHTAGYSGSWDAGYYLLTLKLLDTGMPVWSWVETVRIVAGQDSSGTYALTEGQINSLGSLEVVLWADLQKAIPITLSGGLAELTMGNQMTVTANPTVAPDSYSWYLNGQMQSGETAQSITVGSGLAVGSYSLNVVVQKATSEGLIASSEGLHFWVVSGSGMARWARTVSTGSDMSAFSSVAIDPAGNVYAAGFQDGMDTYTYGPGVTAAGPSSLRNVVLVKYDPSGTAQWAQTVSTGPDDSYFWSVAVDSLGYVYGAGEQWRAGWTYDYGEDVSATGYSSENGVLVKYDATGTAQWARTAVSSSSCSFRSVAVDAADCAYVAGWQSGTSTFTYGTGVTATGPSAQDHAVLVKYDSYGTAQWARTVVSGSDHSSFLSVAVDSMGNVYVAGLQFGTGTYAYGPGVAAAGCSGENAVLVKYDALGNAEWVRTAMIGPGRSHFASIAIDDFGNIYAAGAQEGNGAFVYGEGVTVAGPSAESFNLSLVKFGGSGSALWAKSAVSGSGTSKLNAVAVDTLGNVWAAGLLGGTESCTFGGGVSTSGTYAGSNVMIVRYNGAGAAWWARTVGGASGESVYQGVAVDPNGNVCAAGYQCGVEDFAYGGGVTAAGSSTQLNAVLASYEQ